MTARDVASARLRAQLLSGPPATSPEDAARRLLAVQAQDARAFRLAIRARSAGVSASDVDAALTQRRSLVVSWLCRGTLHLVASEDYWWLHQLTAHRQLSGIETRLRQLGVTAELADRGVRVVLDEVAAGPRSRRHLATALADAGVPTVGQASVHVLGVASLRAHLVRGPVVDGEHCFVDATRWLGAEPPADLDTSLERLATRYLAAHGPATPADLAAFAGVTLGSARRAFSLAEGATVAVEAGQRAAVALTRTPPPPPRLLGMFDPVLHGWADRGWVVGTHQGVVTVNGMFRATALVNGRVAGLWSLERGTVSLRLLGAVSRAAVASLEREAASVLSFLGLPEAPVVVGPGE